MNEQIRIWPLEKMSREDLGRIVREAWVQWAKEQPDAKPHWLEPWDDLGERFKEVDRRIGEAVRAEVLRVVEETLSRG